MLSLLQYPFYVLIFLCILLTGRRCPFHIHTVVRIVQFRCDELQVVDLHMDNSIFFLYINCHLRVVHLEDSTIFLYLMHIPRDKIYWNLTICYYKLTN